MDEKKVCVREGDPNAQNAAEGVKEYQNPSQQVYHGKDGLSIVTNKNTELKYFTGIREQNCAWCGKNFVPTRPKYALGDCCSYTCCLRFDELKREKLYGCRGVVMYDPETLQDILKFDSAREASEYAGVDASKIRNACNGMQETAGDKHWRWIDEIPWYKEPEPPRQERRVNISVYVSESVEKELVKLAKKYDVTRNRMASIMVEKAIEKKEYGNV